MEIKIVANFSLKDDNRHSIPNCKENYPNALAVGFKKEVFRK